MHCIERLSKNQGFYDFFFRFSSI